MTEDHGAIEGFNANFQLSQFRFQEGDIDGVSEAGLHVGLGVRTGNVTEPSPNGLEESRSVVTGHTVHLVPSSHFTGNQRIERGTGQLGGLQGDPGHVTVNEAVLEATMKWRG